MARTMARSRRSRGSAGAARPDPAPAAVITCESAEPAQSAEDHRLLAYRAATAIRVVDAEIHLERQVLEDDDNPNAGDNEEGRADRNADWCDPPIVS
jgi:hypothetical protein